MLQKISISNKCSSFDLFIHQYILKMFDDFHKNIKQQNSLLMVRTIVNNWFLIIDYNNYALNQHSRMISERSCDTEDWSNGYSATTGINYILN